MALSEEISLLPVSSEYEIVQNLLKSCFHLLPHPTTALQKAVHSQRPQGSITHTPGSSWHFPGTCCECPVSPVPAGLWQCQPGLNTPCTFSPAFPPVVP